MDSTRRAFLGAAGAAAAFAARPPAKTDAASKQKLYVAACTPCDKSLKFDEGIYKEMMPYFKEKGVDGVVVLGTTGEYPSFSIAERKKIAETALKHRSGLSMIVQVGTTNFPDTIELLQHAQANGADGTLCIPPFYYKKPATEGLTRYYSLIMEASKIPVHLYHIPGTSEVPITHELLHSLEKYPVLAGIKDSTGNPEGYAAFVKEFPKLNMMSGTSNNLKTALANGMGAILADANIFPKDCADIFATHRNGGDVDAALAKLREHQQAIRAYGTGSYGPMKYALSLMMGTRQTYQRPPFLDVTEEQKAGIKAKLTEMKLTA